MTMPETCPRCGADEKNRAAHVEYVVWECGSSQIGEHFKQGEDCKQQQLVAARPKDHVNRERRVLEISNAVLKHDAELQELATEVEGMGCNCGNSGAEVPDGHGVFCTLTLAWVLRSHKGLEPPDVSGLADRAREEANDVCHLTPAFRAPVVRATCPECERYAHRENQIPHADGCSKTEE